MSRNLCLTRQCLGLVTRIECAIRPLAGDTGMWTLLFAAGMAGEQPSAIKAQGPFHGPFVAESILDTIVESLTLHGYELADDPQIWCLHLQAQLREINGGRCRNLGASSSGPTTELAIGQVGRVSLVEFDLETILHGGEVSSLIGFQAGGLAVEVMHAE